MKCLICKQGETRPGLATVTLERDGATLVIRGVPARVCAKAARNTSMSKPPRGSSWSRTRPPGQAYRSASASTPVPWAHPDVVRYNNMPTYRGDVTESKGSH